MGTKKNKKTKYPRNILSGHIFRVSQKKSRYMPIPSISSQKIPPMPIPSISPQKIQPMPKKSISHQKIPPMPNKSISPTTKKEGNLYRSPPHNNLSSLQFHYIFRLSCDPLSMGKVWH